MTTISTEILAKYWNPFETAIWGDPVSLADVSRALREKRFASMPGGSDHAARIAYLVENEACDAIEIDVGVPSMGCHVDWPVTDGNHRLAAAIYASRKSIPANVGGSLEYAAELFGIAF